MAQDQNYYIKNDSTLSLPKIEDVWAVPICCIWGVWSKAVTGWIDVSTGTCSLSISRRYSQGHISFQHLHVCVFVRHHADKHTDTLRMRGHQHLTAWERRWPHADLMVGSVIFWQLALRFILFFFLSWLGQQLEPNVRLDIITSELHWKTSRIWITIHPLFQALYLNVCSSNQAANTQSITLKEL